MRHLASWTLVLAVALSAGCRGRTVTLHASGDPIATRLSLLAASELTAGSRAVEVELDDDGDELLRLCNGTLHLLGTEDPSIFTMSECFDAVSPERHRIGHDAVAIVVPALNDWASSLRISEIERIFWSAGRGLRWSDLRAEWPTDEIALLGPRCEETSCRIVDTLIPRHRLSASAASLSGVKETVESVAGSPAAVGWMPLIAALDAGDAIRAVPIEDEAGNVAQPSVDCVNAGAYPLSSPLFMVIPPAGERHDDLDRFVSYLVQHRSRLAPLAGLVPPG